MMVSKGVSVVEENLQNSPENIYVKVVLLLTE